MMDVPSEVLVPSLLGLAAVVAAVGRILWAALTRKIDTAELTSAERHKACEDRALRLEVEIREMWMFQRDRLSELSAQSMHREDRLTHLLKTNIPTDEPPPGFDAPRKAQGQRPSLEGR